MITLIFSKDRPMQLEATLRSYYLECQDNTSDVVVIYKASTPEIDSLYRFIELGYSSDDHQAFPPSFRRETVFQKDVLNLLRGHDYVCFVVDDSIFINPFSFKDITEELVKDNQYLGCSLRIGSNITYCYPASCNVTPARLEPAGSIMKYNWGSGHGGDWGYPLELSSSVYQLKLLLPFIESFPFDSPNLLEAGMAWNMEPFRKSHPWLLCYPHSVAFCAPVNKVQNVFGNRAGTNERYSAENLLKLFKEGFRINLMPFMNFSPKSCHQEVEFDFVRPR